MAGAGDHRCFRLLPVRRRVVILACRPQVRGNGELWDLPLC
jgi:hypothetical protein